MCDIQISDKISKTPRTEMQFSGLTYASNLIPIRVDQACPGVQYL